MPTPALDVNLAYFLAQQAAAAHRRAGRGVGNRLAAHIRALDGLLTAEDGTGATLDRGSSDTSGMSLLTAEQASAELGVSPRQARNLGRRIGGRKHAGRWLFDPAAVAEHRDGRTTNDA
ncbi:helix-turn-helix domain-containing protein [Nocardia sp. AG03]|uniref:helix-turn-helix domain-containing protein n=1 Tax=Nocardia sp. AG03 TaxID=3025312 RepID=UPI002418A0A1|nr:helix-turn-helix domain-containing protein [Nocardia sp. AG03]